MITQPCFARCKVLASIVAAVYVCSVEIPQQQQAYLTSKQRTMYPNYSLQGISRIYTTHRHQLELAGPSKPSQSFRTEPERAE